MSVLLFKGTGNLLWDTSPDTCMFSNFNNHSRFTIMSSFYLIYLAYSNQDFVQKLIQNLYKQKSVIFHVKY